MNNVLRNYCYLPAGCAHEYRNASGGMARAICGIAPSDMP